MDKPSFFSILTAHVRYSTKINDFSKILFSEITALCNKNGYCNAKNETLGRWYSKTTRTISRAISALEKEGFINVDITKNASGTFRRIYISLPTRQNCLTGTTPNDTRGTTNLSIQKNSIKSNNIKNNKEREKAPFLESEFKHIKDKEEIKKRTFPNNKARKTYKAPPTFEQSKKPYEMFLNNYPFTAKGWTQEIIKEFLIYCEVRAEGRKFSTAQIKLRLTEVNEALKNQDHKDIVMLLKLAQNGKGGGWASFEFDERIKDRKKDKSKKHNVAASYDAVKDQLNDPNFLFNI